MYIYIYIYIYQCEGINFPSGKGDWKKFEINNTAIVVNVLCIDHENF